MNGRDIVKVGFAVLAAVMSYNFADTIVHAEETSVEPVKETAPVENQDDLTDVIDAVVEDTNYMKGTGQVIVCIVGECFLSIDPNSYAIEHFLQRS